MSTIKKLWSDNDEVTVTYSGSGDSTVTLSTGTNEGLDRYVYLNLSTSDGKVNKKVTINQLGLREIFNASDGGFLLSDGTTFNVLKE